MNTSESMEMYLETIYVLENSHGHAHSVDIAKKLGVSKPSVSKATNYLKEKGFINKESYGSITLTDKGKKASEKVYRRHKLITSFLTHALNLSLSEAEENACRMEHVITQEMADAMRDYLHKNKIDLDK